MQGSMDFFAATCDNLGLDMNTEKTVAMHQPPSDTAYDARQINVNGAQLQVVDNFTYLGSTPSCSTKPASPPTRYGICERELLAIYLAIKNFRNYIC
ncbi:hypothetical protein SprV_0401553700 [Sparganum proliferum]